MRPRRSSRSRRLAPSTLLCTTDQTAWSEATGLTTTRRISDQRETSLIGASAPSLLVPGEPVVPPESPLRVAAVRSDGDRAAVPVGVSAVPHDVGKGGDNLQGQLPAGGYDRGRVGRLPRGGVLPLDHLADEGPTPDLPAIHEHSGEVLGDVARCPRHRVARSRPSNVRYRSSHQLVDDVA